MPRLALPAEVPSACEATGPYWLSLYAVRRVIRCSSSLLCLSRRGLTLRGPTTDPVDARLIAEIRPRGQVPAAHGPTAAVPGRRDVTRLRADLVAQIGDVKRRISRMVERTCPACAPCCTDVCGQAARTLWATWPLPEELAAGPTARLAAQLARLSHGHVGAEQARAGKAAAQQRIGGKRAADALACALRLRRRQSRALEGLGAELAREINRR